MLLLFIAAFWDIKKRIIPDTICCLILGVGIIGLNISQSLLGLAFTGLPYFLVGLLSCKGASLKIGGGDIKLISACSVAFGSVGFSLLQNIFALIFAFLWNMAYRKRSRENGIPMAPFFFLGSLVAFIFSMWGNPSFCNL